MIVVSISLDSGFFDGHTDVVWRHKIYASRVEKYFVIVLAGRRPLRRQYRKGNLYVIPTNSFSRLLYVYDALLIIERLARDQRVDLLTVQDPFVSGMIGVAAKLLFRIPLNVQIHSDFFGSRYFREESLLNWFLYNLGLIVLLFADTVRARSRPIGKLIEERFPRLKGRIGYISMPVNQSYLAQATHLVRDPNLVASVGRLEKQKNYPMLIEAAKCVVEKFPGAKFKIVGEGSARRQLTTLIQKLGLNKSVFLLGYRNSRQIIRLLDHASVFVLSSNHEGWAMVCLEALARGVPVVMTKTGCAGEIVIDGESGFFVDPGDVTKMAGRILYLLDHPQRGKEMAAAGRQLVEKDSDHNNISRQMLDLYSRTVNKAR